MKKICFIIVLFILSFCISKKSIKGNEQYSLVVIYELGVGEEEDLIIPGYQIISGNVDFSKPGTYQIIYKSEFTNDFYTRTIIIVDKNEIDQGIEIQTASKDISNGYAKVTKILNVNSRCFFICGYNEVNNKKYGFIAYYENLEQIWINNINNDYENEIVDICLSKRGVVVTGTLTKNIDKDIYIIEYDFNSKVINYKTLLGEANDVPNSIYYYQENIYLVATTFSKTKDYLGAKYENEQVVIFMFDYFNYNEYYKGFYGNNISNTIINVSYTDTFINIFVDSKGTKGNMYDINYRYNGVFVLRFEYYYLYDAGYLGQTYLPADKDSKFGQLLDSVLIFNTKDKIVEIFQYMRNNDYTFYTTLNISNNIKNIEVINANDKAYLHINQENNEQLIYEFDESGYQLLKITTDDAFCLGKYDEQYVYLCNALYNTYLDLKRNKDEIVKFNNYSIYNPNIFLNGLSIDFDIIDYKEYDDMYGIYKEIFEFKTNNLNIILSSIIDCEGTVNIQNNQTYDINTSLCFTGEGYLNNEEIDSGYIVEKEGNYVLSLIGPEKNKSVVFRIDNLMEKYKVDEEIKNIKIEIEDKKKISQNTLVYCQEDFEIVNEEVNYEFIIYVLSFIVAIVIGILINSDKAKKIIKKVKYHKILFIIFMSLFFIPNTIKLNAQSYDIASKEIKTPKEVVYTCKNAYIYSDNEEYFIFIDEVEYLLPKGNNYKIIEINNKYKVLYTLNKVLYLYDIELSNNIKMIDCIIEDLYLCKVFQDKIYIGVTTSSICKEEKLQIHNEDLSNYQMKNILLYVFDESNTLIDVNIYGGIKNESIKDMAISDQGIYLLGIKEPLTGNDLSYAGNLNDQPFLLKISFELEIVDLFIFEKESQSFEITTSEGFVFVRLDEKIVRFNGKTISDKSFISYIDVMDNTYIKKNYAIMIVQNGFIITDLITLDEELLVYEEGHNLVVFDDLIYDIYNEVFVDIVDKKKFKDEVFYNSYDTTNENIEFIFGKRIECNSINDEEIKNLIAGDYKHTVTLKSDTGITYETNYDYVIPLETNVSEGGIYNTGYKLFFTGYGSLNGKSIYNNYTIEDEGQYQLELTTIDENKECFNFLVSDYQIKIDDEYHFTNTIYLNDIDEPLFKVCAINSDIIKGMVNGNLVENFIKKDDGFYLKIDIIEDIKQYHYYIEYLVLNINNVEYKYYIDRDYFIKIIQSPPIVKVMEVNKNTVVYDCDECSSLRYLEIISIYNNIEKSNHYSISDHDIVINDLVIKKESNIKINIVYDLGNNIKQRLEVLNLNIIPESNNLIIGKFTVLQFDDTLKKFEISLKERSLSKEIKDININDQNIYNNYEIDYQETLKIALLLFVIVFFISFVVVRIVKKRKYF